MIISGTNEQNVVDFIVTRWNELKDARSEKEDVWMDCVRAYLSEFDEVWDNRREIEGRSTRYLPLSFDAIETITANIFQMTTPGDRWFNPAPLVGGRLEHDDVAAEELRVFMGSQLKKMGFSRQYRLLLKQLGITGNCPYTVGWHKEMATDYPAYVIGMAEWQIDNQVAWARYQQAMQEWQAQAELASAVGQPAPPKPSLVAPEPPRMQSEDIIHSGPSLEVGDIFNFVVDPFSTDSRHQLKIQRTWVPKSVLESMAVKNRFGYSVYDNTGNLTTSERRTGQDSGPLIESYSAFGLQVPASEDVELLTAWGTMEIPNGHEDGRSVFVSFTGAVANEMTCMRFEPTFLWSGDSPTQLATYRDIPGQVYGIGALEPALGIQDLANVRANQNIDVVNYTLNPEYKGVDDGYIRDRLISAPSKIHWVGDINNLVPLEKDIRGLQMSMNDVLMLKDEFKMTTKSGSPLGGNKDESATKSKLDARMVGADIGMVAEHIEENFLCKALTLFVELNAQYLSEADIVRATQRGVSAFAALSPQVIRQGWAIDVRGTQYAADKQERSENLMMFFQLVMGNPMLMSAVDQLEFGKKVYSELGFSDGDDIFNDGTKANQILGEMIRYGLVGNGAGAQMLQQAGIQPTSEAEGSSSAAVQ